MLTISSIHRFISALPKNRIFTTREVLIFGTRGAVDRALGRLVKAEIIVRLARGVFMRYGSKYPTVYEVATAKLRGFGKKIAKHGSEMAAELQLIEQKKEIEEKKQKVVFTTTGSSSQFWFGKILIKIKGIAHRKMKLNENKAGRAMAALWHQGKDNCNRELIEKATRGFNRIDRQQQRLSSPLIPAWIDRFFFKYAYPKFMSQYEPVI